MKNIIKVDPMFNKGEAKIYGFSFRAENKSY